MTSPSIVLLTPTDGRPEILHLCQTLSIPNQYRDIAPSRITHRIASHSPIQVPPALSHSTETFISPPRPPTCHPLRNNLRTLLNSALDDDPSTLYFFFEDDDYYAPGYLNTLVPLLHTHSLCGFSHSVYYSMSTARLRLHTNTRHSSLCNTGFTHPTLHTLLALDPTLPCSRPLFDIYIWNHVASKVLHDPRPNYPHFVGLKGLPGLPNINTSRSRMESWSPDTNLSFYLAHLPPIYDRFLPPCVHHHLIPRSLPCTPKPSTSSETPSSDPASASISTTSEPTPPAPRDPSASWRLDPATSTGPSVTSPISRT